MGGRLRNASIPSEVKHPVLLAIKHHVTNLIVRKYHEELAHVGREHVFTSIIQKFWIVKGSCGGAPCVRRMPLLP